MNPSKENSWEHQQQAIDTEIISVEDSIRAEVKSLEDSIHALKRRRNALAPISSLPAERVDLAPRSARGFIEMLLEDDGGCERPLLPSLTDLRLIENSLFGGWISRLRDTLMKRVEQGVPLEVLDLRTCSAPGPVVRLLSEIVVDVWGPTESEIETDEPSDDIWDGVHSAFICDDDKLE
ncbi:hypothetical protein V8E53_003020 [Lactarius tabidus]